MRINPPDFIKDLRENYDNFDKMSDDQVLKHMEALSTVDPARFSKAVRGIYDNFDMQSDPELIETVKPFIFAKGLPAEPPAPTNLEQENAGIEQNPFQNYGDKAQTVLEAAGEGLKAGIKGISGQTMENYVPPGYKPPQPALPSPLGIQEQPLTPSALESIQPAEEQQAGPQLKAVQEPIAKILNYKPFEVPGKALESAAAGAEPYNPTESPLAMAGSALSGVGQLSAHLLENATILDIVAIFGPKAMSMIGESNWFRKLTIPERALVSQQLSDEKLIAKIQGMTREERRAYLGKSNVAASSEAERARNLFIQPQTAARTPQEQAAFAEAQGKNLPPAAEPPPATEPSGPPLTAADQKILDKIRPEYSKPLIIKEKQPWNMTLEEFKNSPYGTQSAVANDIHPIERDAWIERRHKQFIAHAKDEGQDMIQSPDIPTPQPPAVKPAPVEAPPAVAPEMPTPAIVPPVPAPVAVPVPKETAGMNDEEWLKSPEGKQIFEDAKRQVIADEIKSAPETLKRKGITGQDRLVINRHLEKAKQGILEGFALRRAELLAIQKRAAEPPPATPPAPAPAGKEIAPVKAREPWEITLREFQDPGNKPTGAINPEGIGGTLPTKIYAFWEKNPLGDGWRAVDQYSGKEEYFETAKEAKNALKSFHKQHLAKALSEGKPVPPSVLAEYPDLKEIARAKQPWEMTFEQWKAQHPKDRSEIYGGNQFHHDLVKEKLAQGVNVPPSVLAEYPDLKAKADLIASKGKGTSAETSTEFEEKVIKLAKMRGWMAESIPLEFSTVREAERVDHFIEDIAKGKPWKTQNGINNARQWLSKQLFGTAFEETKALVKLKEIVSIAESGESQIKANEVKIAKQEAVNAEATGIKPEITGEEKGTEGQGVQPVRLRDNAESGLAAGEEVSQGSNVLRPESYRNIYPKARGGYTKDKIKRALRGVSSSSGENLFTREVMRFSSPDELEENLFFHGTGGGGGALKPSIVLPQNAFRSGGYGQDYWGVSLSKSKNKAAIFTGSSNYGTIYPVILKKGAVVKSMPEIQDAQEIEDHIEALWDEGVDAVKIGDWTKPESEQELVVLNPRAIATGKSESFKVFGGPKFPNPTKEEIGEMWKESSKKYEDHLKSIGKPPLAKTQTVIKEHKKALASLEKEVGKGGDAVIEPPLPNKQKQHAISQALKAVDILQSKESKKAFESAYSSLKLNAYKLGIETPKLGTYFNSDEYRKAAETVQLEIGKKYGSHPTAEMRAKRLTAGAPPRGKETPIRMGDEVGPETKPVDAVAPPPSQPKAVLESKIEKPKEIKGTTVVILPNKKKVVDEIMAAIKKAPEVQDYDAAKHGTVTFKIDGGAKIKNSKDVLGEFLKAVRSIAATEKMGAGPSGLSSVPKSSPDKEEIGELYEINKKGWITDGDIILKGPVPKGAEFGNKKASTDITALLKTPTTPAQKVYYAVLKDDFGGISEDRIGIKEDRDLFAVVVFKFKDGYLTYKQAKFNAIDNAYPKARYGITKEGALIASDGGKPVGMLMPMAQTLGKLDPIWEHPPLWEAAYDSGFVAEKPTAEYLENERLKQGKTGTVVLAEEPAPVAVEGKGESKPLASPSAPPPAIPPAGPVPTGSPVPYTDPGFKIQEQIYTEIVNHFQRVFGKGVTIERRIPSRKAGIAGLFVPSTKNIYTRALTNIGTAMHEVVHYIDDAINWSKPILKVVGQTKDGKPKYDPATKEHRKALTAAYLKFYCTAKADHPLKVRVQEGLAALLVEAMLNPAVTKLPDFQPIVKDILSPGGKFHSKYFDELSKKAREIYDRDQALSPSQKIKARTVDTDMKAAKLEPNKSFMTAYDTTMQQTHDRFFPLSVIARMIGKQDTPSDPAVWANAYVLFHSVVQDAFNANSIDGLSIVRKDGTIEKVNDRNFKQFFDYVRQELGPVAYDDWQNSLRVMRIWEDYQIHDEALKALEAIQKLNNLPDLKNMKEVSEGIGMRLLAKFNPEVAQSMQAKEAAEEIEAVLAEYIDIRDIINNDKFSRADAEAGQRDFMAKGYDKYQEEWMKLNWAAVQQAQEAGRVTNRFAAKAKQRSYYASFKRAFMDEVISPRFWDKDAGKGQASLSFLKGRKGSELPYFGDPMYNAVMNYIESAGLAQKQIPINKLYEAWQANRETIGTIIDVDEAHISPRPGNDKRAIYARVDGMYVPMYMDKVLKEVIEEDLQNPDSMDIFVKIFNMTQRIFTTGTTALYPQFATMNLLFRDIIAYAAQSKTGGTVDPKSVSAITTKFGLDSLAELANLLTGETLGVQHKKLAEAIGSFQKWAAESNTIEGQAVHRYFMLGGERHMFAGYTQRDMTPQEMARHLTGEASILQKAGATVEGVMDVFARLSEYSEALLRAQEFVKAVKMGKTDLEAWTLAGNVTAPFHKTGHLGGKFTRAFAGHGWPFFRAGLAAMGQAVRTAETPEGRKRLAWAVSAVTAAMIGSLTATIKNGSEEQKRTYRNIPPQMFTRFLYLPDPSSEGRRKGELIRFGLSPDYAAIGSLINTVLADYWLDTKYSKREILQTSTSFVPDQVNFLSPTRMVLSWLPQFLAPHVTVALGLRTYPEVRPIVPRYLSDKKAEQQYDDRTSLVAKKLGDAFDLSPMKIDYWIEGVFGRASKYVTGKPVIGTWFKQQFYLGGTRSLNWLYDMKEINSQTHKSLKDSGDYKLSEDEAQAYKIRPEIEYAISMVKQYNSNVRLDLKNRDNPKNQDLLNKAMRAIERAQDAYDKK